MKVYFRRVLLALTILALLVPSLCLLPMSASASTELSAEVKNVIKVTIDTTSQAYKDAVNGLNDDDYVNYGTAVLPLTYNADSKHALKDNNLGDWWNAWTEITISWDFYTENYLAGMNGIGLRYEWGWYTNDGTSDQNGYKATDRSADYVAQ